MKIQELFYLKTATADYFSVKLQGETSICQLTEQNVIFMTQTSTESKHMIIITPGLIWVSQEFITIKRHTASLQLNANLTSVVQTFCSSIQAVCV